MASSRTGSSSNNRRDGSSTGQGQGRNALVDASPRAAFSGARNITIHGGFYSSPSPQYGDTQPATGRRRDDHRFIPNDRPSTHPRASSAIRDSDDMAGRRQPRSISSDTQNMPPPPKQLPKTCCNCGGKHKVLHCPKPNTDDGRLQACLECNTTDHPWFKCKKYKRDDRRDYINLWVNRMGLCCIVHNRPAHIIWQRYIETDPGEDRLEMAYERPGPLTPDFVLKMLDKSKKYAEIQKQISQSRVLPWDLETDDLVNTAARINRVVLDPATLWMSFDTHLRGTTTRHEDVVKLTAAHSALELPLADNVATPMRRNKESLSSLCRRTMGGIPLVNKDDRSIIDT